MHDRRDEELMQAFCAGNSAAFQLLFERYRQRLYRFIRAAYEPDAARAEDATQEVFLRVIRHRERFDPTRRFSTWLYTVARHYCLNEARAAARRFELVTDTPPEAAAAAHGGTPPAANGPRALGAAELADRLRQAVAALPEPQRSAFVLREVDGLEYADVAAVLHEAEGAVRVQVHRAKARLRQLLTPYLEGQPHA